MEIALILLALLPLAFSYEETPGPSDEPEPTDDNSSDSDTHKETTCEPVTDLLDAIPPLITDDTVVSEPVDVDAIAPLSDAPDLPHSDLHETDSPLAPLIGDDVPYQGDCDSNHDNDFDGSTGNDSSEPRMFAAKLKWQSTFR